MKTLNVVDLTIIACYFAVLIIIGICLSRRASASMENYFLGGRKLPWWALGISGMASWLDDTGTSLIVAFLFMLGPRGLFVEFRGAVGLIMIFMMLWTGKWHRRSGCLTAAEWMEYRFGNTAGGRFARIASALASLVMNVGMLAMIIKGSGQFYSTFLPFSPIHCAMIMIGIATLYTIVSGFYGVVFNDIFQAGIIATVVVCIAILAATKVSDTQTLAVLAEKVTHNPMWFSSMPTWKTSMPDGYTQYSYLGMFMLFYLMRNIIGGMGAGGDPKYFGAKNDRECAKLSLLWSALMTFRWPMAMAFAILGLFLVNDLYPDPSALSQAAAAIKQYFPDATKARWQDLISAIERTPDAYSPEMVSSLASALGEDWIVKLKLLSFEGTIYPERIMPAVILNYIPMGLRGFVLIALIAAALSTFATILNQTVAFFVNDLYKRYFRPIATTKELMGVNYIFGVMFVVASFGMAYTTTSINDIWGWVVMGLGGGFIVPAFLRFYWWRFNGGGFAIGTVVGGLAAIAQRIFYPNLDERLQFGIIFSIGLTASIVGTYLSKPADQNILYHFFKTTRPFGIWPKRFAATLDPKTRATMKKEHFLDIVTVPFVFLWQVSMYLMPMQLLIRNFKSFWVTLAIFMFSAGVMYFVWYRNLPAEESERSS